MKKILLLLILSLFLPASVWAALTPAERRIALQSTNDVRATVGLPALRYSIRLEQAAQKWADILAIKKTIYHSDHASRPDQGENLYIYATTAPKIPIGLENVIQAWADEMVDYNYQKNTCTKDKLCGHYTQIVWRETREVGCAKKNYTDGKWTGVVWVCRYSPPGNYIGEKPY